MFVAGRRALLMVIVVRRSRKADGLPSSFSNAGPIDRSVSSEPLDQETLHRASMRAEWPCRVSRKSSNSVVPGRPVLQKRKEHEIFGRHGPRSLGCFRTCVSTTSPAIADSSASTRTKVLSPLNSPIKLVQTPTTFAMAGSVLPEFFAMCCQHCPPKIRTALSLQPKEQLLTLGR